MCKNNRVITKLSNEDIELSFIGSNIGSKVSNGIVYIAFTAKASTIDGTLQNVIPEKYRPSNIVVGSIRVVTNLDTAGFGTVYIYADGRIFYTANTTAKYINVSATYPLKWLFQICDDHCYCISVSW